MRAVRYRSPRRACDPSSDDSSGGAAEGVSTPELADRSSAVPTTSNGSWPSPTTSSAPSPSTSHALRREDPPHRPERHGRARARERADRRQRGLGRRPLRYRRRTAPSSTTSAWSPGRSTSRTTTSTSCPNDFTYVIHLAFTRAARTTSIPSSRARPRDEPGPGALPSAKAALVMSSHAIYALNDDRWYAQRETERARQRAVAVVTDEPGREAHDGGGGARRRGHARPPGGHRAAQHRVRTLRRSPPHATQR